CAEHCLRVSVESHIGCAVGGPDLMDLLRSGRPLPCGGGGPPADHRYGPIRPATSGGPPVRVKRCAVVGSVELLGGQEGSKLLPDVGGGWYPQRSGAEERFGVGRAVG